MITIIVMGISLYITFMLGRDFQHRKIEKYLKNNYPNFLDQYVRTKHTQQECKGFMDSFESIEKLLETIKPIKD